MRRFLVVCLLLGVSSLGTLGHAASASPSTLGFEAPWECPNRDYFWHQLWSRSVALSHATHAAAQLALDVRIEPFGTSYSGVVRLRDAAGAAVERRVSGPVCVDVTMALALAAAIVLDTSPEQGRPEGSVPERQYEPRYEYSLGATFGIHTAASPTFAPAFGVAASLRALRMAAAPELRLEALGSVSGRAHGAAGLAQARFIWISSRTSLCALRVTWNSMDLGPCAVLEVGALHGVGLSGTNRQSQTGLWLAPGALLFWALRHGNARLSAGSGFVVPLERDRFIFSPDSEVFHPPSLGFIAEVGLAWTFEG